MADVTERDVLTLAKMLGLLGSDQVGERAAAALKAHQWVVSRGLAWKEVLLPEAAGVSVRVKGEQDEVTALRADVVRLTRELASAKAVIRAQEASHAAGLQGVQANPYANMGGLGQQYAYQNAAAQQAAYNSALNQRAAQQAYQQTVQPPWLNMAKDFLANHQDKLKGSRELDFLTDQIKRGTQFGARTKVSPAQEAWLSDILGRAGFVW